VPGERGLSGGKGADQKGYSFERKYLLFFPKKKNEISVQHWGKELDLFMETAMRVKRLKGGGQKGKKKKGGNFFITIKEARRQNRRTMIAKGKRGFGKNRGQ